MRTILGAVAFVCASSVALGGADTESRIAALKSEIRTIALENQLRQDNLPEIRAQLQPLVDELESLVPARTESQKKEQVVGVWHSLWSDMSFGPVVDYANVFQVVYPEGFYYNISREVLPNGAVATGYLRGSFADVGDSYRIEFTRNAIADGWFDPGVDLWSAGLAVENGTVRVMDVPGPVGVRGDLQNVFVDEDLRIVVGKSDDDEADSMFVLSRGGLSK